MFGSAGNGLNIVPGSNANARGAGLLPARIRVGNPRRVLMSGLSGVLTLASSVSTHGQQQPVAIEGGPDESGHLYSWTVTNQHDAPITEVEFPHFRADLFSAPAGWTQETTNLVNVGVADEPGICKATAPSPSAGIAPGGSGEFSMRITAKGASRGTGSVMVRFEGGASVRVAGVALPQREATLNRFIGLVSMGGVLGLWILFRALRGGKRRAAKAVAETGDA